jgi:DNA-binding NarL/FixJ family response regulator
MVVSDPPLMVAVLDPLPAFRDHLCAAFSAAGNSVCDWTEVVTDRTRTPKAVLLFLESRHRAIRQLPSSNGTTVIGTIDNVDLATLGQAKRLRCSALVRRSSSAQSIVAAVHLATIGYRVTLELESTPTPLEDFGDLDFADIELKILSSLATGSTITDLSQQLSYSRRQIHRYVERLCQRLGVQTPTQAVALAARWGYVADAN